MLLLIVIEECGCRDCRKEREKEREGAIGKIKE